MNVTRLPTPSVTAFFIYFKVSSDDEDVAIFQRNIKSESAVDEEKDFDESLSEDLWTDVFHGGSSVSSNEGGERGSPVLNRRTGFVPLY